MYITKQKETHIYREQTRGYQWVEFPLSFLLGEVQDRDVWLRDTTYYA